MEAPCVVIPITLPPGISIGRFQTRADGYRANL
jgi:hypothetical protein